VWAKVRVAPPHFRARQIWLAQGDPCVGLSRTVCAKDCGARTNDRWPAVPLPVAGSQSCRVSQDSRLSSQEACDLRPA
jgi:hypothetical protein